jgi:hypothetical protein
MIALALSLAALLCAPPARRCEEHGPRLDGTFVTICQGSVVRVRDRLGNSRRFLDGGRIIILESPGAPPVVLDPQGR